MTEPDVARHVSLTTFGESGEISWKVRRLRDDGRVELRACRSSEQNG